MRKFISPYIVLIFVYILASCNSKASSVNKMEDNLTTSEAKNNPELEIIINRILELPEMKKLERPTVMLTSEPTDSEPYYTLQAGNNSEEQLLTLYWFRAYTTDDIRFWDVIEDTESPIEGHILNKPGKPYRFSIKDETLYKGATPIDCEIHEITKEGSVRYRCFIGPELSSDISEEETGLWIFASSGEVWAFIPLTSEYALQDFIFNEDQTCFVIETGSSMHPDIFYQVLDSTGVTAEFSALRGSLVWISPTRFIFTKIEGVREGEDFINYTYALCYSASMYDTKNKKETLLKKATKTQNYMSDSLSKDGLSVIVIEQSVVSEQDWSDPDKPKQKEITVKLPD